MSDKENKKQPVDYYPGVARNVADKEKVDEHLVKQAIKLDNDNPRSNDIDG